MLIYKDVRGQYDESTGTFGPADGIVDEQDYIKFLTVLVILTVEL